MALGDVIRSFDSGLTFPAGMAWDGRSLWLCDFLGLIVQIDPSDGTIIQSFTTPDVNCQGLTWDGQSLWLIVNDPPTNTGRALLYQIDPSTHTVIRVYRSPAFSGTWQGAMFDGQHIWVTNTPDAEIRMLNVSVGRSGSSPNFEVIRGIRQPATNGQDIGWDGKHIWISDITSDISYEIDPIDGTVIRSFSNPSGVIQTPLPDWVPGGHPPGHLWLVDGNNALVYQVSLN